VRPPRYRLRPSFRGVFNNSYYVEEVTIVKQANIVEKGVGKVLGGIGKAAVSVGLAATAAQGYIEREHETSEERQKRLIREVLAEKESA